MTSLPAILALFLVMSAVVLWLDGAVRYPKAETTLTEEWVAEVRDRLPEALDAQGVKDRGVDEKGRPLPVRIRGARPIPEGWAWKLDLPGSSVARDWDPGRIVAAVNSGGQVAAVAEVHSLGEGWAELQLWPSDPLALPRDIPWDPGQQAPCCRPGTVCMGPQRTGEHVHFDIYNGAGGLASLFAGRRGSGKSEAMRLALGQMVAWGNVSPVVVDLVRSGVDYADLEPLLAYPVITDPEEALVAIQVLRQACKDRSLELKARGLQMVPRYTRDMPLLPYVVDEVHSLMEDKALKREVIDFTRETRPMGGVTMVATQYPTTKSVDGALRAQMTNVWAGRLRNPTESNVTLGSLPEGLAPHLLRLGPGGAVCDVDGPDLLVVRGWRIPEGWMAEHVRAIQMTTPVRA